MSDPIYDPVTYEQAVESHQRMVDRAFGQDDKPQPRLSIPARPDHDDDLLLSRFIREQADLMRRLVEHIADHYVGDRKWHDANDALITECRALIAEAS